MSGHVGKGNCLNHSMRIPKLIRRMAACAALTLSIYSADIAHAEPTADNGLNQALAAWQQGDLQAAGAALDAAIDSGSTDARLWYFRGVIAEQSGQDGSIDFQRAAANEIATSSTRIINQALEKVQGPVRLKIESAREAARANVSPDPKAARTAIIYRDAVAMIKNGDLQHAIEGFDKAIAEGSRDARVQYMRGIALARLGDLDAARMAFQQGLSMETTHDQIVAVNFALQSVQGDIRQMIEEQVQLGDGDAVVTRQSNQRMITARHIALQNELLAGDSAQREQLLAEAEASRRAREEEAVKRILAAEEKKAATDALIKAAEADLGDPTPTQPLPPEPMPSPTGRNPFGVPASAAPTAEAPGAATAPPANPFLALGSGGANASTGTPLDTSWLAPNSELVFYARPADVLTSRFLAPVLDMPEVQSKLEEIAQQQGLPIAQIESVTGGMGDLMAKIVGLAMGGGGDPTAAMGQFMNNPSAISVMRMNADFDLATVASTKGFASQTHGDKTYYLLPTPDVPHGLNMDIPQSTLCQIDSRTMLSGTEVALKAALDRGVGQSSMPQFSFVSSDSHLAIGFSNPALAAMSGSIPTPQQAPPMIQELVNAIKGQVNGFALAFDVSANLKLNIKLSLNDAAAGQTAIQPLQATLQMAQQMYPVALKANVPAELQPVADGAVNSLQASVTKNVLNVSLDLPGQLVTILRNNPQLLQPKFGPGAPGGLPAEDPSQGFRPGPPGGAAPGGNPSQGFGFPPGDDAPAPPQ